MSSPTTSSAQTATNSATRTHKGDIRPLNEEEIRTITPLIAEGWKNQTEEFDYEFAPEMIEGSVPVDLRGTFVRNGPGLNVVHGTQLAHPIDGDGMIVQVSFEDGRARMKSRFVETYSHVAESKEKRMLFPGSMGSRLPGESSLPKERKWRDPSHTNVFAWGGKLVTCYEYSLPNSMDPVSMSTLGQDTLGGALGKIRTLGAHFRIDADLDLLCTCSFRPGAPAEMKGPGPLLEINEFDRSWKLVRKTACKIPGLNYVHDFLLTPDYYIVHMTPFVKVSMEGVKEMISGKAYPGEQMRYYPDLPSRIVLIERRPSEGVNSNPRFIELDTDPCHIFHFGNCRQTRDANGAVVIRFNACCLPPGFNMQWQYRSFLSNTSDAPGVMHAFEVVLKEGSKPLCKRTLIEETKAFSCEFPVTHPYRNCLRDEKVSYRYFYMMASQPGVPLPFSCVVKYDIETKTVTRWNAEGAIGEPCYIPRLGSASAKYGEEDDGYIIVQHYLYREKRTEFCILDAKKVEQGPICRLKLKERIPYGFHGTYTPDVFLHMTQQKITTTSKL